MQDPTITKFNESKKICIIMGIFFKEVYKFKNVPLTPFYPASKVDFSEVGQLFASLKETYEAYLDSPEDFDEVHNKSWAYNCAIRMIDDMQDWLVDEEIALTIEKELFDSLADEITKAL